jgi:hypothetical protein
LTVLTADKGVSTESRRAETLIAAGKIFAEGVDSAHIQSAQAFIDINATAGHGISVVAPATDALARYAGLALVATGVGAAAADGPAVAVFVGVAVCASRALAGVGADEVLADGAATTGFA